MDIHELYDAASVIHGHRCPGLAIGIRAAFEAKQHLGTVTEGQDKPLLCVAEHSACWMDGIGYLLPSSPDREALSLDEQGEPAFDFYAPESGESLRLCLRKLPENLDRQEKTEYILSAPLSEIFDEAAIRHSFVK